MEPSDETLMSRVMTGDMDAFAALFDRRHAALHAFLQRIVPSAGLAEDLTQEVFWKVWTQSRSYDLRRPFAVWLYALAKNAALDALKRHRRETTFSALSEGMRSRVDETPDLPGRGLENGSILRLELRDALYALPPEQRIAVVLKEYEGRSYREIGEILERSEGSARVLAHRGRLALRAALEEAFNTEADSCLKR